MSSDAVADALHSNESLPVSDPAAGDPAIRSSGKDKAPVSDPAAGASAAADSLGAPRVRVAGAWRRAAAAIIDLALLLPVFALGGYAAAQVIGIPPSSLLHPRIETLVELVIQGSSALYGAAGLMLLICVLYNGLFTATTGSTPGLRLVGARVIDIYGARPAWWRTLLRGFGLVLGTAAVGLGSLWIAFDHEKRGLHDRLAGTYVIRTPRE